MAADLTPDDLAHRQRIATALGLTRLDMDTARRRARSRFPKAAPRDIELHTLILATGIRHRLAPAEAIAAVTSAAASTAPPGPEHPHQPTENP
jgi:hypothetical protein